jgi:hypothetical protein
MLGTKDCELPRLSLAPPFYIFGPSHGGLFLRIWKSPFAARTHHVSRTFENILDDLIARKLNCESIYLKTRFSFKISICLEEAIENKRIFGAVTSLFFHAILINDVSYIVLNGVQFELIQYLFVFDK